MGVRVGGLVVVSPELVLAARASRPVPAPPMSTLLKPRSTDELGDTGASGLSG